MSSKVYIFIGPAGSGKTTLIERFVEKTGLRFYDILDVMKPYLKKYGTVTEKNKNILDSVVAEYIRSFNKRNFDILEFATGGYLPQMLRALRDKEVFVIYCKCPLSVCRKRMRMRERKVPDHYVKYQSKFKTGFYKTLLQDFDFKLITIDMKTAEQTCFNELNRQLAK